MKLGKMITTTLSVVGGIVIVDRLADAISTTHKKQISKCLNNLDKQQFELSETSDEENGCCCGTTSSTSKEQNNKSTLSKIFPDIKKYTNPKSKDNDDNFSFQYTIQVKPSEESIYSSDIKEASFANNIYKSSINEDITTIDYTNNPETFS
jgi:hypothetical protein